MSDHEADPAANTDKFRAFVEKESGDAHRSRRTRALVAAAAVAVLGALAIVAVAVSLSTSG